MSGSSFKNLESSAASMWSRYFSSVYGASLEIMGNTKVKFNGHIKIAVYTKFGFLHHTSGIYHIQGITDTIFRWYVYYEFRFYRKIVPS